MKICAKDGVEKDDSEFYKDKSKRDGLSSYCKDCCKEKSSNQPRDIEYERQYRKKNSKKINERSKNYRDSNIDHYRELESLRRKQNREAIALQRSAYQTSDKGRLRKRINAQKRRAKIKGCASDLSNNYWLELLEYFGSKCMQCGSEDKLAHDHIIPLSWGIISSHTYMNAQILCNACNSSKKDYWSIDFTDRSLPALGSEESSYDNIDLLKIIGDDSN